MLYIFGDIHLSAINPWNYDVGESFIKWFDLWCQEVERTDMGERNILWLGDITEKDVNPGDVIDQEYRIFSLCSKYFKHTYIVMGNHDLKLYKQKAQHSLKFLRNLPGVTVIEQPTELNLNNTSIRALPHVRVEGVSLTDYYSNMKFDTDVNLTVGHWCKLNPNAPQMGGVDVSNMRSRMFCLGHIHTRMEDCYTGSIFANKSTETGTRVYKIFDNGNEVRCVPLPNFLDYQIIHYPDDPKINLNSSPWTTVVYDVDGVNSIQQAKLQYPQYYIRGVVKKKIDTEVVHSAKSSEVFLYKSNIQAYNDWLKESKYPLSRGAAIMISDILK